MTTTATDACWLDLAPAPVDGGFRMAGYWVWCGSVVRGDDGQYHMFAARWPKTVPFAPGYPIYSEVVRAVSPSPVGPYEFAEIVLPARGEQWWDGRMSHNPTILKIGDTYALYYIGSTFRGPCPPPAAFADGARPPQTSESWLNIRIGLATAPSPAGPWTRRDTPILEVRPDRWDALVTTNPAPCLLPDGSVHLYYRSSRHGGKALIGVARARNWQGPYERLVDHPILDFPDSPECVEDPFVWHDGGGFRLCAKDLRGGITGEFHAGAAFHSPDGIHWQPADPPKAYSRTVHWTDGRVVTQGCLERPFILFDGEQPTHFFAACADGPGGFTRAQNTWNAAIPIRHHAGG